MQPLHEKSVLQLSLEALLHEMPVAAAQQLWLGIST